MEPSEQDTPYRVFWCTCGQKMRVPLKRLGRVGHCVHCRKEILPTLSNTTLPGEGPLTPPPQRHTPRQPLQLFKDIQSEDFDVTPPPEKPPAGPPRHEPTPAPAEPFPFIAQHNKETPREKQKPLPAEIPEQHEETKEKTRQTQNFQSLKELLGRLKKKRESLYTELGAAAYRLRDQLPKDPEIARIIEAISKCNDRISKYEDVLAEIENPSLTD
jgi:hypothetical protein